MCRDPVPTPAGCRAGGDGSHRMCLVRGMGAGLFDTVEEWEKMSKDPEPAEDEFEGKWRKMSHKKVELPVGIYYVGDPCYLKFPEYDSVWGDLFGHTSGHYTDGTKTFVVANTAYGDGSYKGSDDKEYLVDSGTIAIVNSAMFDIKTVKEGWETFPGALYGFTQPVTVRMGGGKYTFDSGWFSLTIDTDADCSEEEDEY
jgi:hypothetical protein